MYCSCSFFLPADQFTDTEGTTIFVKGFDRYLGEDAIREQLTEAFAACGEVSNVRLPSDRESGELKGIGFIEFATTEAKVSSFVLANTSIVLSDSAFSSFGALSGLSCRVCIL